MLSSAARAMSRSNPFSIRFSPPRLSRIAASRDARFVRAVSRTLTNCDQQSSAVRRQSFDFFEEGPFAGRG